MAVTYQPGVPYEISGVDNQLVYDEVKSLIEGSFLSYLIENSTATSVNGGQVVITIPSYANAGVVYNSANLQSQTAAGTQLSYLINQDRQAGYEYNAYDVNSGRAPQAVEVQNQFIATVMPNILKALTLEYLNLVVSNANVESVVMPNFTKVLPGTGETWEDLKGQAMSDSATLFSTYASLLQTKSSSVLGAKWSDFTLLIPVLAQKHLNTALTWAQADAAYNEQGIDGGVQLRKNNGITYVVDEQYLGVNHAANSPINSSGVAIDFSNVVGLILHSDAVSFRFKVFNLNTTPMKDKVWNGVGYVFGGLVFRPELCKKITLAA